MVIAFKQQFKQPILDKKKVHTLREDKHNRWKPGMKMHMATGVRTKNYNQFNLEVCQSTQNIKITNKSNYLNETEVTVDGRQLSESEIQQLAWNDGFENLVDFWWWFQDGFTGKIIHWTNLKY